MCVVYLRLMMKSFNASVFFVLVYLPNFPFYVYFVFALENKKYQILKQFRTKSFPIKRPANRRSKKTAKLWNKEKRWDSRKNKKDT